MQKLVRDYLNELNEKQRKRRRAGVAAVMLVVLVVGAVIGALTQYGVAMTGDVKCGLEEHQHMEACYTEELTCGLEESEGHTHTEACRYPAELVCGLEETGAQGAAAGEETAEGQENVEGQAITEGHTHTEACYIVPEGWACGQEESEGHTHTEACYTSQITCGKEEHTHTEDCYIDKTADVEDISKWDAQYAEVEWKDSWSEDLVTAAQMQIGYKESSENYTTAEDGSHKGYTRYGQFVDDVYRDWDVAFVNFCMYYAGLTESNLFPNEMAGLPKSELFPEGIIDPDKWCEEFRKINEQKEEYLACLTGAEGYTPKAGDVIFLSKEDAERKVSEDKESVNQMGIVSSYNEGKNEIKIIEGNVNNEVKENVYSVGDSRIVKYLMMTELEGAYKNVGEEQPIEPTEPVVDENITDLENGSDEQIRIYEDEDVIIQVSGKDKNAIPEEAILKVVPVLKDNEETSELYKSVESQIIEKVEQNSEESELEYSLEGFLAYDISLVNGEGEEIKTEGSLDVSMNYKKAVKPDDIVAEAEELDVKVMHLEENESGEVQEVVDMSESNQLKEVSATDNQEVQRVEIETDSFSVFSLVWTTQTLADTGTATYDAAAAASGTTLGAPEHHKYIKRNGNDTTGTDNYTLSLDVKGKQQKKTVDIMMIVDVSNSMKDKNSKGVTRHSQVTTAVNNMVDSIKTKIQSDVIVNVGIVEFSDGYNKAGDFDYGSPYYQWTTDGKTYLGGSAGTWYFPRSSKGDSSKVPDRAYQMKDTVSDAVKKQGFTNVSKMGNYKISKFGCGTNWQAGVQEAEKMLAGRNNETYVIFLTDGLPTVRYKDGYRTQGAVSDPYYQNNTVGFTGNDNPNYKAAVSEWNNSANLKKSDTYIVYAGDTACKERCNAFAKSINAENNKTALNGTSATALKNTFNTIVEKITAPAYTNVSITDTLSDNVEFAFSNPSSDANKKSKFKVTQINADGKTTKTLTYNTDYTLTVNGKTYTVNILKGGRLANNVTYRVQVDVIPSQKAILSFLNGTIAYPNTGDAKTDGPGTVSPQTSSGKKGFYSNDNNSTKLTYSVNGKNKATSPYEKPVIQVESTTRSVKKEWIGEEAKNVKVSLTAKVQINGSWMDIGYINTVLANEKHKQTLNAVNSWKGTWNNLPKYYYYYDSTTGVAKHVPVKYIVSEDAVYDASGKDVTADYQKAIPSIDDQAKTVDSIPITIKNTNVKKNKLTIIKTDSTSATKMLQGAKFTLKARDVSLTEQTYEGVTDSTGKATFDNIPNGTYLLTEIEAPVGYMILKEPIEITLPCKGSAINGDSTINADGIAAPNVNDYYYAITKTVTNNVLYELPSTGGMGIYWYMFSGILLMSAAILITYRNKRKEVLKS